MKIKDVMEWLLIADEDLYSAQILNQQARRPYEIICYHCAQAAEKYLKGYLAYIDAATPKTYNLSLLLDLCIESNNEFEKIRTECGILNKFTNEIRYPYQFEIKDEDVLYSISAVKMIKSIKPINDLIDIISKETKAEKENNNGQ
ncbi:MAG: HEPN domain-containing protein [Treponema sp.]|jgi:HEPN domain-containing protein|nr:HEPN domain-containing protein [Treponema sp.]